MSTITIYNTKQQHHLQMINETANELAGIPAVVDPFCERRFWENDRHQKLPITNPVSAGTGLLIMFMAICTTNIDKSGSGATITRASITTFHLCRASLGIVGAGTVVFHSIDDTMDDYKALNFRMCDWMPIVLMCTNIMVLYISKFEKEASECCLAVAFISMYIWTSVLILAVDSRTYEYLTLKLHGADNAQNVYGTIMNVVLLVPLGITLAFASCYHFEKRLWIHIWGCIAVNLALWIGNAYGCKDTLWLSMLHAIYHVTIAYTFLCAACMGMTIDGAWGVRFVWYVWPMIWLEEENNVEAKNKPQAGKNDASNSAMVPNNDNTAGTQLTNVRIENIKLA